MNEFIDKLIGRLEEKFKYNSEQAEIWRNGSDKDAYFRGQKDLYIDRANTYGEVMRIVNQLAEEHKGGWIPCSERLPEDMQTVLFTSKDGYVDCGLYDADKNWCVNDNYFPNAFRFIAWQPLPAPYKAEEPQTQWKQAMMNTFLKR